MSRGLCKVCEHCMIALDNGEVLVFTKADDLKYRDKFLLTRDRIIVRCLGKKDEEGNAIVLPGSRSIDEERDCFEERKTYAPLPRVPACMWGDEF